MRSSLLFRLLWERPWVPALGLALLALALRLPGAWDYWVNPDEGITCSVVMNPNFSDSWREIASNAHPPLYFLFLRALGRISTDFHWLRFLSVLFGASAVFSLFFLGRVSAGRPAGLMAALFLALSPAAIEQSQLLRPYMAAMALTLPALFFLFSSLGDPHEISGRRLALFSLFMTLALLTNYEVFLVFGAAVSAVYVNYMMVALALSPRVPGILVLFVATLVMMRAGGRARGEGIAGAVLGLGVLVDPFLLLYVPGFLLISRRRLFFTAALLVVVTPWTVRNSVMEGTIVPVYAPSAIELDLSRWVIRCPADFYRLVDKTYVNAAGLVSRGAGWIQPAGSETSEAIRNSTTFGAYFYLVVALGGLVGVLRHHSSRHGPFLRPALIYLGILVLFSTARNTNRLLAEHIAIFYSALLLVWIARWLRSRRESTPARSGRGDVAGRSYG